MALFKSQAATNRLRSIAAYAIPVILVLIAFFLQYSDIQRNKKEVAVYALKEAVGPSVLIQKNMLVTKTLAVRDYNSDMIKVSEGNDYLFGDKERFSANYIPAGVPLQKSWLTDVRFERFRYLKEMGPDEEAVFLPYNPRFAGGNVLRPGDHIRLRATYHEPDENGRLSKLASVDVVFEDVKVVDLLNSRMNSILDIIERAEQLPPEKREELLASKEFENDISPRYMVLILKKQEADSFYEFQGNAKINFTASILTRNRDDNYKDLTVLGNILERYLKSSGSGTSPEVVTNDQAPEANP